MKVQVKSNGIEFEIAKVDFDKFSSDQKRNYTILNSDDAVEAKVSTTTNTLEVKEEKKVKAVEPDKK